MNSYPDQEDQTPPKFDEFDVMAIVFFLLVAIGVAAVIKFIFYLIQLL